MWFDDASLMRLEEVDWKIGNDRGEVSMSAFDQRLPDTVAGFDETLNGMQEARLIAYDRT